MKIWIPSVLGFLVLAGLVAKVLREDLRLRRYEREERRRAAEEWRRRWDRP